MRATSEFYFYNKPCARENDERAFPSYFARAIRHLSLAVSLILKTLRLDFVTGRHFGDWWFNDCSAY